MYLTFCEIYSKRIITLGFYIYLSPLIFTNCMEREIVLINITYIRSLFCNSLLVFFKEFDLLGSFKSGAISHSLGSPSTSNSGLESAEFVLNERKNPLIPRCLPWRGGVSCLLKEQSDELDTLVLGVLLKKLKPVVVGGGESVGTEK